MKKWLRDQRGTTMVNVLVAFAMLLVVCGIFYRAVNLSLELSRRSEEIRRGAEAALTEYYEADKSGSGSLSCGDFALTAAPGVFTASNGYQYGYFYHD